jgi:hypothetical protein
MVERDTYVRRAGNARAVLYSVLYTERRANLVPSDNPMRVYTSRRRAQACPKLIGFGAGSTRSIT